MADKESFVVGRIPFLVCAPFFHLSLQGVPGLPQLRFLDGTPAQLNGALAQGEIVLAPTSSFEYALHAERYRLLPDLCTSGRLEIRSVRLFSHIPWEALHDKTIRLSPASATSNALCQVLSKLRYGVTPRFVLPDANTLEPKIADAQIAIGDEALLLAHRGGYPFTYDLAAEWRLWHGLPFAFGLWIVHEEMGEKFRPDVMLWKKHLHESVQVFSDHREEALARWCAVFPTTLPQADLNAFYDAADYALTESHLESLRRFYQASVQIGLLPASPSLRMWA